MATEPFWWRVSFLVSMGFAFILGFLWFFADLTYDPNENQLVNEADVDKFLQDHLRHSKQQEGGTSIEPPIYVRTGIFVQSFRFVSAVDVNITGYIWQEYKKGTHDGISHGFVFPEMIDSGSNIEPRRAYERTYNDKTIIGWYFESTLRQTFLYDRYPLDHKTVRIQMWHKDFDRNVVLTPHLSDYDSTQPGKTFGINKQIILGDWKINETFFQYKSISHDTNFGIEDYIGQRDSPELYFNIVLKRKFLNAFIVNLVPLCVVAGLLFGILMTITANEEKASRFGFSTFGVMAACSGLFFVIMISHIQLRQQLAGSGIVYLEYFYLLMYVAILAVTINAYLFSEGWSFGLGLILYKDNMIPKLLFWPLFFGLMVVVTLIVFKGAPS